MGHACDGFLRSATPSAVGFTTADAAGTDTRYARVVVTVGGR
jgi:hypothetical protein